MPAARVFIHIISASFELNFRAHALTNFDFIDDGDRLICAGGISITSLATT